jgi:endo-1,4-beta-xylanase
MYLFDLNIISKYMKAITFLFFFFIVFQMLFCQSIKEVYKPYFDIGVAVSAKALTTDESNLILNQFNSITAENAMKIGPIHPKQYEYNWKDADSIAAFAYRNKMKMRGHTLCWHNQMPNWFFKDDNGDTISKEVLYLRMKEHITTIVKRYKDNVYAWDVVNEAISDNKDEFYRKSLFYEIAGEEYIAKAFEFAHDADPNALLFYNDYNEISDVKREKIIKMISQLKEKGVPIHGVGLQGHWAVNEPSFEQLDKTLADFSKLGLNIQITELDISVYPKEHNAREANPEDYDTTFSTDKEEKQIDVYKNCFKLFLKYHEQITSVTFWNISDRHSWLDNFPVKGRKDYPLLFDSNLKGKKVFEEVIRIVDKKP